MICLKQRGADIGVLLKVTSYFVVCVFELGASAAKIAIMLVWHKIELVVQLRQIKFTATETRQNGIISIS